jgi:hypothetical protein
MTDQDTEIRSLAAMTGTQGEMPQTRAEKDVLMLGMIATALGNRVTWAQIGSALGWGSGREAKRRAHQMRRSANARLRQQAVSAQIAGGSGDG